MCLGYLITLSKIGRLGHRLFPISRKTDDISEPKSMIIIPLS